MALTKEVEFDYEKRTPYKHIQQRKKTTVYEDGVELSSTYHRASFTIGDNVDGIEDEATVKMMTASFWTPEVSASFSNFQTSQSLGL